MIVPGTISDQFSGRPIIKKDVDRLSTRKGYASRVLGKMLYSGGKGAFCRLVTMPRCSGRSP